MRSIESAAIQLLRTVEARAADDRVESVHVDAAPEVALYLLNEKRSSIADIEADCHVSVRIEADEDLKTGEFKIEGRAEGNVVQPRPMQPIDLRRLKPLPAPAADEIEEEDEDIIEDSEDESEEEDGEGHDHEHDNGEDEDGEDEVSADADEEDDDHNRRGRRGRRGGRRRRGGRERGEASGPDVAEPTENASAPPAAREDDGRGRGGRRRRRGGRDRERDRGERNRTPDIATDGGEMLDAIASAPFLVAPIEVEAPSLSLTAAAEETASIETELVPASPDDAATRATVLDQTDQEEAGLALAARAKSEQQATTSERQPQIPSADHEIAATRVEAPLVEAEEPPAPDVAPETAAQAEARRHAIHGAPDEPELAADKAPRKSGWWSRRKTG
jgi:ribonuclease E